MFRLITAKVGGCPAGKNVNLKTKYSGGEFSSPSECAAFSSQAPCTAARTGRTSFGGISFARPTIARVPTRPGLAMCFGLHAQARKSLLGTHYGTRVRRKNQKKRQNLRIRLPQNDVVRARSPPRVTEPIESGRSLDYWRGRKRPRYATRPRASQ